MQQNILNIVNKNKFHKNLFMLSFICSAYVNFRNDENCVIFLEICLNSDFIVSKGIVYKPILAARLCDTCIFNTFIKATWVKNGKHLFLLLQSL